MLGAPVLRQDFMVRLIQQMAEAIARIAGLREQGAHHEALELIESSCRSLGADRKLRQLLTPESLAKLLGDPEKLRVVADLLEEESRIYAAKGDAAQAIASQRLSEQLRAQIPRADD
jgi:hypothetical protein